MTHHHLKYYIKKRGNYESKEKKPMYSRTFTHSLIFNPSKK